MFTPEVGGVLNRTVHLYAYGDMNERERTRKDMLDRAQWTEFLNRGRPFVIGPQVTAPSAAATAPKLYVMHDSRWCSADSAVGLDRVVQCVT